MTASRDTRLRQVDGADAALHSTKVRDPGRADEALKVDPVDPLSTLDEMAGRIDVRPGVRSEIELAEVDPIPAKRHRWADPHGWIAAVDRHRVEDRDADVDQVHASQDRASAWRRISATLQACVMQPTGR